MKALLLPSTVGRSHLTRLLLVAEALRERGAEVAFAYGGEHTELLDERGIQRVPVADVSVRHFDADVFSAYSEELLEQAVRDVGEALGATGSDVLVFDLHPAGAIAAHEAGVPCAAVTNADLTAGFDVGAAFANPERRPGRARRIRAAGRGIRHIQARAGAAAMRSVARRHGMRDRDTLFDFQRGDRTLLADLPEWAPSAHLDEGTRYIGPLVWEEEGDPPPPDERDRTVYVTIGNTGRGELLDAALSAFPEDAGFRLLISSGAYVDPPQADRPDVHARRFLPGSAAARASALVLHCGGSGTTYQTLGADRPMIVVPYSAGQRITAQLVARHRVGAAFEPNGLDPARLRAGVEAILATPGYRMMAGRFASRLRKADGPGNAAEAIEGLLSA